MHSAESGVLTLVQMRPRRDAVASWAARRGWLGRDASGQANPDLGYIWHALLRAAFGELAPQPFVDRVPMRSNLLLGYSVEPVAAILQSRNCEDRLAAEALGLDELEANSLPAQWPAGKHLSFEVRVRPVVRSRAAPKSGKSDEVDVVLHRARLEPEIGREQAYMDWLRERIESDGAARMGPCRLALFRRTQVMRRRQGESRQAVLVEGPEAWICGRLEVGDSAAFGRLVRRGVGRHRAFGFGCLLLAPPGILE